MFLRFTALLLFAFLLAGPAAGQGFDVRSAVPPDSLRTDAARHHQRFAMQYLRTWLGSPAAKRRCFGEIGLLRRSWPPSGDARRPRQVPPLGGVAVAAFACPCIGWAFAAGWGA